MVQLRPKKKRWKKRRANEGQMHDSALVMTGEQVVVTSALLVRQGCTFYVVSKGHNVFWMICDNGFDALTNAFDRAMKVLDGELKGLDIQGPL